VTAVAALGDRSFRLISSDDIDLRPEVFRFAADNRLSLVGLRQEENSLEAVFHQLTVSKPAND
jgi:ABC-2 type transport system ATP-binding protein